MPKKKIKTKNQFKINYLHVIIAILFLFIIFLSIDSYNKTTIIKTLLQNKSDSLVVKETDSEPIKVDKKYKTDVLVIGGNGAGLVSAISASENGAKVMLVEEDFIDKYEMYSTYNSPDRDMQKNIKTNNLYDITITNVTGKETISQEHKRIANKAGTDMYISRMNGDNSLFDSEEWFALQTWDAGNYSAKLDLVRTLCENAYDGYLWLKKLGIKFSDEIYEDKYSIWPRTHKIENCSDLFKTYLDKINNDPDINFLSESKCSEILYDNDKIIGACFEDISGKKFVVNSKSIIITADSIDGLSIPFNINKDASVLDENQIPIEGLYSCGKSTIGIHGSKVIDGNQLVEEVVFGRIAGKSAAECIIK